MHMYNYVEWIDVWACAVLMGLFESGSGRVNNLQLLGTSVVMFACNFAHNCMWLLLCCERVKLKQVFAWKMFHRYFYTS